MVAHPDPQMQPGPRLEAECWEWKADSWRTDGSILCPTRTSLRPPRSQGENAMTTQKDHRFQFHEKCPKDGEEYNEEFVKSAMKV